MTSEFVRCDLIDILPLKDKATRSRSKDFAANLAHSIEAQGQQQPIVLRPSLEQPGRFKLVSGWHRLFAIKNVLKREVIEAKILVDMDDEDADWATIAENLWRNALTKAQHLKSIAAWHDYYAAKYPAKVGRAAGLANTPNHRKAAEKKAPEAADAAKPIVGFADPEAEGAQAPAPAASFAEVVAASTGQSLSAAKEDVKIARRFTADQLEVFEQMRVGKVEMATVAAIKDEGDRGRVVNLIASGMEVADAIRQVTRPADGVVRFSNGKKVQAPASDAASAEPEAPAAPGEGDMTDEVWVATYCGGLRDLLPEETRARFDADAAFYRNARDARNACRKKTKKAVEGFRTGPRGAFLRAAIRFLWAKHPQDWLRCGKCSGRGRVDDVKCGECFGDGYVMQQEVR